VDTFPAASLAQPKRVFCPNVVKVKTAGGIGLHPGSDTDGGRADSVTMNPAIPEPPTSSAAVKAVIGTVNVVEVSGIVNVNGRVKDVTVGGTASRGMGLLFGSPGKVLAVISCILLKPSPSESRGSMTGKLYPLAKAANPYGLRGPFPGTGLGTV
jgi:hypothetical protein